MMLTFDIVDDDGTGGWSSTPERVKAWHAVNGRAAKDRRNAKRREHGRPDRTDRKAMPFVGVDGEGAGPDGLSHTYQLLRVGEWSIGTIGRELHSREILRFLAGLPTDRIYVIFSGGYDFTMWTRDLSPGRIARLLDRQVREVPGRGGMAYPIDLGEYGVQIDMIPRKEFRVRYQVKPGAKPRPWVVINETFGFFQTSFVKTLQTWNVGTPEQRQAIVEGKRRRGGASLLAEDAAYNDLECVLLAELMGKVRDACHEAGFIPTKWQGAGSLAASMLRAHGSLKRTEATALVPPQAWRAAADSYYGGRFEVTALGAVGDAWEYDLASAYPHAMSQLPCLRHATWDRKRSTRTVAALQYVTYRGRPDRWLHPLPWRRKAGGVQYPSSVTGWYWDYETRLCEPGTLTVHSQWCLNSRCACHEYGWVEELYRERLRIGKGGKGIVLKLGLNSLYGKQAQTRPSLGPYTNFVYASMITSMTRARIYEATVCPEHPNGGCCVMVATDGVYFTHQRPDLEWRKVDGKSVLGTWEESPMPGLYIFGCGLYRNDAAKLKTRGIAIDVAGPAFDRAADDIGRWIDAIVRDVPARRRPWPQVETERQIFVTAPLALGSTKYEAGTWINVPFRMDLVMALGEKRDAHFPTIVGERVDAPPYTYDEPKTSYLIYDKAFARLETREDRDAAKRLDLEWGDHEAMWSWDTQECVEWEME